MLEKLPSIVTVSLVLLDSTKWIRENANFFFGAAKCYVMKSQMVVTSFESRKRFILKTSVQL